MGTITNMQTGQRRMLAECTVVGRAPACDLRLQAPEVSAEHAALRWTDDRWRAVDLDSRNGTWVAGSRLSAGASAELDARAVLCFGSPKDAWVLDSVGPPTAFARGGDGDLPISSGLALPSDAEPIVQVWAAGDGTWMIDDGREQRPAEDREIVRAKSRRWRLYLPTRVSRTAAATGGVISLEDMRLVVAHDRTEEHVHAELRPARGRAIELGSRAHNVVLLELSRVRLEDRAQGIEPAEEGWIHREDLARRLQLDEGHVNIWIYRLRRQLADVGVVDAANVVERRHRSGLLRVGPTDVHVERLA